ncbi:MAG: InlB B-repeat-containing protein, partial [Clostridia bacterium]|nr:InlB B-repeat-containing protein [Clostridia bacterium]
VLSNPFDSTEKFFLGWNTNANGTGKFYPHYSNLNVMGLTDLYGQWITASRYVKYNALKAYDSTTATVDGVPGHDDACSGKNNENYTMLVDNDETTKWCFSPRTDSTWYLEFETKDYITPVGYALVTSNDTARYTGRNPKNWALEGLNGNGLWVVIDEVTDDTTLPGANYVQMVRSVRCAGEYCRFRISFRGLVSGSTFQLSELFLLTDGGARQPVLTFDPHGGEGSMAQAARPNYSSVRLPANTFVREGYDFAGWNTKADGSGVAYRDEAWYRIDGDATLYAQWSKSPFRIVFLGEDGTTLFEDTVDAGALPVYRGPAPVKDADADASYVFSGWDPVIVPVKENTEYRVRFDRVANTYGDPVWEWSSDHKSVTAVFTCINNPDKVERVGSTDVKVTSTPATCTGEGKNVYSATVSFLGNNYTGSDTVTVRALGHDIISHPAKSPTCTDVGWDAYDTCSRCDYTTYVEKGALGHDYQSAVTEPTCTEQGFTTHTCSRCGDTYTDGTVPATGHDYKLAEWIWTGFTSAKAKFVCSHDASHVQNVSASIKSVRTDPTAEKAGSVVYTATVTFEGVKYTDNKTEVIPALGHDYVLEKWSWDGYVRATAKFVDNNGGEPIELDGVVTNVRTEPTCVKAGKVVYTASVIFEGTEYKDDKTETIEARGHDLTRHDAKAPTCTEIGWDAYDTCTRCDYSTYAEKAALGHDLAHHDAKAPTCTEIGWDAYDTCTRCDYSTYA